MNQNRQWFARPATRGFTLTELMIVVSIMGLLLAVSVPGIQKYLRSWRLNGEASSMAMSMRAARSTAVNKNIDVVFVFDQSEGEYYYVEDADGDGSADSNEIQSGVHELSNGITIGSFTTPQQWITFSPRGSTADGGTITVAGYNSARTIQVYSGTGNVSIQ
jgi:prepilin-type N-terminal cleavage/methylation domain-containing protein